MNTPDNESISWIRVILAFGGVLMLMSLLALGLKMLAKRGILTPQMGMSKGKRLQVVESMNIDMRRKLVIVRRDNREHLLLLGNERDLVVESFTSPESLPKPASDTESP